MSLPKKPLLSFVVPLFNESAGLGAFHESLLKSIKHTTDGPYEILYCDDGSTDNSADLVRKWHATNKNIKLLKLSRNFGKEYALSAGISEARGQAILMLDGDGQHPVELIPAFVEKWNKGAQVVIGVRKNDGGAFWFKRLGSMLFYRIFNNLTTQHLVPGSTDYRLIDRAVRDEFVQLRESNRITRGLIDWLGFRREYIDFTAKDRMQGSPTYSRRKLIKLAIDSLVSFSPKPLYLFGYLGTAITSLAFIFGAVVLVEQLLLHDPLRWRFTGTAMLGILILFLVGILLVSQSILSLYIANIQNETKRRPLYVIDYENSAGILDRHDD